MFHIKKPLNIFPEIEITDANDNRIGKIKEEFSVANEKLNIINKAGDTIFVVKGRRKQARKSHYKIKIPGKVRKIGNIKRMWGYVWEGKIGENLFSKFFNFR